MVNKTRVIPEEWEHFLLCIILHLLFPLLPLVFELWFTGKVSNNALFLSTAMYSVAIGMSSTSRLIFCCCFISGFVFALLNGVALDPSKIPKHAVELALFSLAAIFLTHGTERYNKHVREKTPFWEL
jgi:hypothetical protein